MHDDLYPFPETFPSSVMVMLASVLRGQAVDPKEAAHAAWHVVGLGLGKWDVHKSGATASSMTKEEAATQLEQMAASVSSKGMKAIDWGKIKEMLPLLLQILQMLI